MSGWAHGCHRRRGRGCLCTTEHTRAAGAIGPLLPPLSPCVQFSRLLFDSSPTTLAFAAVAVAAAAVAVAYLVHKT